ncbi:MAG: hypothetical protein CUN55_19310, partial [Phototrophicales bacterium]
TELRAVAIYHSDFNVVSPTAIADYLMFGGVARFDKSQTIYDPIRRLKPAHFLQKTPTTEVCTKYWSLPTDVPTLYYKNEESYIEHYRAILDKCMKGVMRGPEIVIALSGGMDSSAVAAIMVNHVKVGHVPAQLQMMTVI